MNNGEINLKSFLLNDSEIRTKSTIFISVIRDSNKMNAFEQGLLTYKFEIHANQINPDFAVYPIDKYPFFGRCRFRLAHVAV